ncbi:MAG: hypothetical protein IJY24_04195 [Clostridia bacterium]|nr:hypothetical protein [Clostridia bacterium]
MDGFVFEPNSVSVDNLDELARDYSASLELRLMELGDIARQMLGFVRSLRGQGVQMSEILSLIAAGSPLSEYPISDMISNDNRIYIRSAVSGLSCFDRVTLCRELIRMAYLEELPINEEIFLPSSPTPSGIAYARNALSDEAFEVFAEELGEMRACYTSSLRDAVAELSAGNVGYCLLPLEEKGGSRLHTVADLIYRNDLKINSVTPVFGLDGAADLKYALVSRYFIAHPGKKEDDRYLELRLGEASLPQLGEIISAIELLGMRLYRIDTVSFTNEGQSERFASIVICEGDGQIVDILVYLALFVSDFTPVGLYLNLE